MNLIESLSSSFEYTRAFFSRWIDWIILLVLTIIPIVDFIVVGYYAKVLRDGASSRAPPKIEGFVEMFVDGLKAFVVTLIYAIPIWIIMAAMIALRTGVSMSRALPFIIILVIVGIIVSIFEFIAIVHMFKTKSFGKAFAFGEILNVIWKIGWPQYIAFLIIYVIAAGIVGVISVLFFLIPIVGIFIAIIVALALSVLVMTIFFRTIGLMYDGAMGAGAASPPAAPAATPPASATTAPATIG